MITELDPMLGERGERTLRAWLEDEPAVLPPHIWSAVMAEVPETRQRQRSVTMRVLPERRWARLLLAAALVTALVAGGLAGAGATGLVHFPRAPWAFPGEDSRLDPGRYVIDGELPVRVSFDVPAGWKGFDLVQNVAAFGPDAAIGPSVELTVVDGVYRDACDPDRGLQPGLGATSAELATAIRRVASVSGPAPTEVLVGGRPGTLVSVIAPPGRAGCTTNPDEPPYQLWPGFGLRAEERAEVRIVDVDGARLAVVLVVPPGSLASDVVAAQAVIDSLRLGADAAIAAPTATPAPVAAESLPPVASSHLVRPGQVLDGDFAVWSIPLYAVGAPATAQPVPARYELSLDPPDGWIANEHGLVAPDGTASIEAWSIQRVHPDPCHWRSSILDVTGRDLDGLADRLATAWATTTGSGAPRRATITDPPWNGGPSRLVDLLIPVDVDPAACDGGELRLWDDRDGIARTTRPGERIRLRLRDRSPGLAVVAFASTADVSQATLDEAAAAGFSVWLEGPIAPAPTPAP